MNRPPEIALVDGELEARPYREADIDDLFAAASESVPDIYPWMIWCHPGYRREESEEWVESRGECWQAGSSYDFALRRRGRFVGGCGINQLQPQNRMANLGYWVRSTARGEGVAPTAAGLVARFGFEELRLERLEIVVAVGNAASLRVAEKLGARREGILRRRLAIGEVSHDAVMYSLIRDDLIITE